MSNPDAPEVRDDLTARSARPTAAKPDRPDRPAKPDRAKTDKGGRGRGKLVLDVRGVETALPPGHAVALAAAACGGTVEGLTVDAVRDAAPEALPVCEGVTLRAQATGDDDEQVAEGTPA